MLTEVSCISDVLVVALTRRTLFSDLLSAQSMKVSLGCIFTAEF